MVAQQPQEANHFELEGGPVRVSYSTTSLTGEPVLTYQDGQQERSFRGDELRCSDSELGRQVTVMLAAVPDLQTVTLTLVLPVVQLRGQGAEVDAVALVTTSRTSIGGPRLVAGALQSYQVQRLTGHASFILS